MRKLLIKIMLGVVLLNIVSCSNKNLELEKKVQKLEQENAKLLEQQKKQKNSQTEVKTEVKNEPKKEIEKTPKIKNYESKVRRRVESYESKRDAISQQYGWGVEENQANDNLNEKLDDELTKVYNLIMERLPESKKNEFRNEQRQWLKTRKRKVKNSVKSEDGEMMMGGLGAANVEMMEYQEITKERLYEFAQIYDEME